MNEASQLILVGIAVAFVAIDKAVKIYNNFTWKRNGKNRRKSSSDLENPGYGERIKGVETEIENLKDSNDKDHRLIRQDIQKLFGLFNAVKK